MYRYETHYSLLNSPGGMKVVVGVVAVVVEVVHQVFREEMYLLEEIVEDISLPVEIVSLAVEVTKSKDHTSSTKLSWFICVVFNLTDFHLVSICNRKPVL